MQHPLMRELPMSNHDSGGIYHRDTDALKDIRHLVVFGTRDRSVCFTDDNNILKSRDTDIR